MTETAFIQGESGVIWEMDLPLQEDVAKRLKKGEIKRVANAKGDPWEEPKPKRVKAVPDPADELKAAHARLAELNAALVEANAKLEAQKPTEPVKAQK